MIEGRVTVLPPDTRHVDYDIVPLMIADGCLYNCGFCRIKSGQDFKVRTEENILGQIRNLKTFFAGDIRNCNALFLGQHDALHADFKLIEFAAIQAYELFGFERSYVRGSRLYLFGSVESFLNFREAQFICPPLR